MTFEIPDGTAEALGVPANEVEHELRKELALALYSRGALSAGKSAELAGMVRRDFELLLAERKVVRSYDLAESQRDLEYANS